MANTLFEFYQSQGQALPSVQQRQGIAQQAGIQNYSGTEAQNRQLLGFLQQPTRQNIPPIAPTPSAITPESLVPVAPIAQPEAPTTVVPQSVNIADQILKASEVQPTEAQQFQENTIQNIVKNMGLLQGEAADTTAALQQAGVANLKQDLQNINSQILQKQAEIAQDDIQLISRMRAEERRDTLLPFAQMGQAKLAGDAQILRALKTSEIGVLNASAIAKQGDIQLAKETAQEAVDAKYAPYKQQIELGKAYLEAIQPLLSRDEKKQAREQELRANLAMREIDKVSSLQKTILSNAISSNAPASVINAINKAGTIEELTSAGKNYLVSDSDRLDLSLKKLQIAKAGKELAGTTTVDGLRQLDDTEYSKFTANPNYKAIQDGSKYSRALDDYKKAVEKYGTREILSAKGKGELNAAYSTLVATTKDYYTLGTLDAGVEKLVGLGVPKPDKFRIRDKRVISSLDKLKDQASASITSSKNQLQNSVYGDTLEFQTLLQESLPKTEDDKSNFWQSVDASLQGGGSIYQQAGYDLN